MSPLATSTGSDYADRALSFTNLSFAGAIVKLSFRLIWRETALALERRQSPSFTYFSLYIWKLLAMNTFCAALESNTTEDSDVAYAKWLVRCREHWTTDILYLQITGQPRFRKVHAIEKCAISHGARKIQLERNDDAWATIFFSTYKLHAHSTMCTT